MINENWVKQYCCEDISLIENYDKAIADETQTWQCHHKAEILPCGRFTKNDLIKHNLYWNRPANELIFLTPKEHLGLHRNGIKLSDEHKKSISKSRIGIKPWHKGMKLSDDSNSKYKESLRKMSESLKGKNTWSKGRIPWNKGKKNVYSEETKQKMRKPKSEEHKRKLSEAKKRYYEKRRQLKINSDNGTQL